MKKRGVRCRAAPPQPERSSMSKSTLRQPADEVKPLSVDYTQDRLPPDHPDYSLPVDLRERRTSPPDCQWTGPICRRVHYCSVCGWEHLDKPLYPHGSVLVCGRCAKKVTR